MLLEAQKVHNLYFNHLNNRFGVRKTIFAMTLPMLITAHCGRVQHAEKLQCVPNALSAAAT